MRISEILSSINKQSHPQSHQGESSNNTTQPSFKECLKNSMILRSEVELDLGTINGKPLKVVVGHEGGYTWNGTPCLYYPSNWMDRGGAFTAADFLAFRAIDFYTPEEREKGDKLAWAVADLFQITAWGNPAWHFDDYAPGNYRSIEIEKEAVRRLGLDPERPFTINGRTFVFEKEDLKEVPSEGIEVDLSTLKGDESRRVLIIGENGFEWGDLGSNPGGVGIQSPLPWEGEALKEQVLAAIREAEEIKMKVAAIAATQAYTKPGCMKARSLSELYYDLFVEDVKRRKTKRLSEFNDHDSAPSKETENQEVKQTRFEISSKQKGRVTS